MAGFLPGFSLLQRVVPAIIIRSGMGEGTTAAAVEAKLKAVFEVHQPDTPCSRSRYPVQPITRLPTVCVPTRGDHCACGSRRPVRQLTPGRRRCGAQAERCTVTDLSDGCGAKIDVLVVSDKFEGLGLLDRQRAVHAALEEEMKTIHAITMKCKTVKQFASMQAQ